MSSGVEAGGDAPLPRLRVLLVDDHADTNRSLTLLLGRRGYEVKSASDMAEAVEACTGAQAAGAMFDVVVCDMGLPDGNGLEILERLRATPPRCGAIILSGYNSDEDVERSLAAGFGAHLGKPVEVGTLDEAIRKVARR